MPGCGANGELDVTHYTKPLPWIGVYIAGGSLLCALAMALDAYSGFRRRNFWFPTRFFSLNATTLTLLGIATKFPVDLNTSMPGRADQLSKLSGTVLICTVTANLMPSLGEMDDPEIVSNVVALGIMIITVIVNVGIQMGTLVIYIFQPEHGIVMFLMMVLLVLMVSSALAVSPAKDLLEEEYNSKSGNAPPDQETTDGGGRYSVDRLKFHVKRHWVMAHSGNPQFVLGRSATCTAAGAFSLLSALVLAQAVLRSLFGGPAVRFCSGDSDYKWSTTLVLISQVAAVVIGTVAPACRWFYAANFRRPDKEGWRCKDEFTVEEYWVKSLQDRKEAPLPFHIKGRWLRKAAQELNTTVMEVLTRLQQGVVLASKLVRLISVLPVSWLYRGSRLLKRSDSSSRSPETDDTALSSYVLHLKGEEDLVDHITKSERKDTNKWMLKGWRKRPKALLDLIQTHSTIAQGFTKVHAFHSATDVAPWGYADPPNCWALPLVTLAAVAASLPGIQKDQVERLLDGVSEGLGYVRLVETFLDEMGLVCSRGAAEIVWMGVDLHRKWLDHDLRSMASDGDWKKMAEKTARLAESVVRTFVEEELPSLLEDKREPRKWPERIQAACCMYRVCASVRQGYYETDADLFGRLRVAISDILGACLTNLPHAIYVACSSNRVEGREKAVRDAALSLGEAEALLKLLQDHGLDTEQYFDHWPRGGATEA